MQIDEVLGQTSDALNVRRVFGEPLERNGVIVIPVARVSGGGGGGSGEEEDGSIGKGVGFGVHATPAGMYVITDDKVSWEPALNLNRVILGGQIVAIVLLLVVRSLMKDRNKG